MKTYKAMKKVLKAAERAFYKEVRYELLQGVLQCLPGEQQRFAAMYGPGLPIETIIKKMPRKKLEWAMTQIQNTFNQRMIGQVVMWRNDYCDPQYFSNQTVRTKDGKTGTWGETKVVCSEGIWT
jgi:hypothetical protein